MSTNLIEGAKSYFTPEVIEKASALVGESPTTTRSALETALPNLVVGLAGRASSAPGAQTLMNTLEGAGLTGAGEPITERLRGMSGEELVQLGKDLLGRVFGDRLGPLVDANAASSGVKTSTMSSLLGLATPVLLGVLGQQIHARRLDASGLVSLLAEQKSFVAGAVPAAVSATARREPGRAAPPVKPLKASSGLGRVLPWLAIPLVILGALLFRRREAPVPATEWAPGRGLGAGITPETPAVEAPPQKQIQASPLAAAPVVSEMEVFLEGSGGEPSRRFVFDDLNFEFATTDLTPSSLATLEGLAHVLEAHPGARIQVEGHTDSLGVPAANERLSLDRAEAVKNALLARGIAAERVTTRGLGQDQPLAPNDTAEGRAKNRRTEIVVTR